MSIKLFNYLISFRWHTVREIAAYRRRANEEKPGKSNDGAGSATGLRIGVAVGVSPGFALGNYAAQAAIGIGAGLLSGTLRNSKKEKKKVATTEKRGQGRKTDVQSKNGCRYASTPIFPKPRGKSPFDFPPLKTGPPHPSSAPIGDVRGRVSRPRLRRL
ncbi:MAG: hypothetical protein KH142_02400 [Slackia piriformis]|uniref:Uncharacterized protein n=1 Tax=Slackia piriformis TaxID=626934 RepID=A0A943UT18_9ACTN|nr:hypothetical protein [Slackia piriformis]